MGTPAQRRLVAQRLRAARGVVVITGAGVSAESGLRTFRGGDSDSTMAGLWKDFDPTTLATPEAFARDPERVTRWYDWRRLGCLAAAPNPGHVALARMEREITSRAGSFTLLTQNVDRLHHKAGSVNVVELHGSIIVWRCTATGREMTPAPEPMTRFPAPSPFREGALLRPNVVWFGEMLPESALRAASEAVGECDVFFTVGTSSVVHPAAGFVELASERGAFCVEVNLEPTPATRAVDVSFHGASGEVLPAIVAEAFGPA